jgi:RIO kinase 1
MPKLNPNLYLDDDEMRSARARRLVHGGARKPKGAPAKPGPRTADRADGIESADLTYKASRHERQWIVESLGNFYDMQWLTDVVRLVKGGKEASVYQCAADPQIVADFIAAKIYRPRMFRSLKNDYLYREGRANLDEAGLVILDHGMEHAMRVKTAYGLKLLHTSWVEHEFKTLELLHAAGADVPQPYAAGDNAILMEYLGGEGMAAPSLSQLELERGEAQRVFERVVWNIDLMLSHDRIHGDLSAYNILYWEGEITLIDFPQAVSPDENRNALGIFQRDVQRVCEYFADQGVRCNPRKLAQDLWTAHHHRLQPELDPRWLDEGSPDDRRRWRKQTGG